LVSLSASGSIRPPAEHETLAYFFVWAAPFPFAVGLFALVLFALLAAVYLTLETDDAALQDDFRRRAIACEIVAATDTECATLDPNAGRALFDQVALVGHAVVGIVELPFPFARSIRLQAEEHLYTNERAIALGWVRVELVSPRAARIGVDGRDDGHDRGAESLSTPRDPQGAAVIRTPEPVRVRHG
jgi:hypothetical protein